MRASLRVDALIGHAQALHGPAPNQVFLHDLFCVSRLDVPVPDRIGINDDVGSMLALVEAERFVDAHASGESRILGELRKPGVQLALSVPGAGGAWRALGADIVADENVAFKRRQSEILQSSE